MLSLTPLSISGRVLTVTRMLSVWGVGVSLAEASCLLRPLLYVGPVPNHGLFEFSDGRGEVEVAVAPGVDDMGVRYTQPFGDLCRSD